MQRTVIGIYTVEVFTENNFNSQSADNTWSYDFDYINCKEYSCPTIIGIKVYLNEVIYKSAIIGSLGGGTGIHSSSCIYEFERVLICCSNSIFCLSIPDLSLNWEIEADSATCFEIFKYKDDYIVHGELEITRLSHDGKILWQQSGRDIFTRLNSTKGDFLLTEEYIWATDWGNNKYKFTFEGEIVE